MRLAVFTVSPNRQYLGILFPTTPEQTSPVCAPTLIWQTSPLGIVCWFASNIAYFPNLMAAIVEVSLLDFDSMVDSLILKVVAALE